MSTALSYPGLRCVLEFLDPMKRLVIFMSYSCLDLRYRIHIAARNHSLRIIDKIIPICIEKLGININCFNLNDYMTDNYTDNELRFKNGCGKDFKIILPSNVNPEKAMSKLLYSYLEASSKIYVNRLSLYGMSWLSLPADLIFRINELRCSLSYIDEFLANIDPSSFPLKKLRAAIDLPNHLNHPVLTSAKLLVVVDGFVGLPQLINENNTNKSVTFENSSFRNEDLVNLVRSWKDNGKEVGTTFKFFNYDSSMNSLLEEFKEFEKERFNASVNCPRLIIPINITAEIHVILDDKNYIDVEVVPITLKRETDATEEPC
ncbi:hypothetical protein CRE_17967 [Caenorhabditis remanei]|uniref:F-box associated domain-containing protein n=1 Tax=Caenorhabditis remanei TaxID=31234 RepID=E3MDT2_CAERE|nr:hypothetical protein CRE_17967 [Caenorhabditis remanei]